MLSMLSLFNDLNNRELEYLSQITQEVSVQRGDIIFAQAESSRDFYIIKHGQVEISVRDIFKEKKVLNILKNGEFFGEMSLFEKDSARSATAQAFQNTTLYKIPGKEFERLLKEQPSISFKLLGTMSKRLREFITPLTNEIAKRDPNRSAKIITISSAKGGYGKTTMAITLASILANELPKKVLYLDLDLAYGDGSFLMGVYSPRTIVDFARSLEIENATEDHINKYVVKRMGGLNVMPAPKDMIDGERVRSEDLIKAINVCKKHFDYIVVDTASHLDDHLLNAIDMSDYLVFLIDCKDPISIKDNSNFFQALSKMNPHESHINLIMSFKSRGLDVENFRKIFKWRIIGELPTVADMKMESDRMPYQVEPGSEFCNAVRLLAKEVLQEPTLKVTSEVGFLGRWFSKGGEKTSPDSLGNIQSTQMHQPDVRGSDLSLSEDYGFSLLKEIRGEIYRGQLDKAQQDCLQLFNLFPSSAPILQILGEIYFLRGDYAAALDVMNKVLDMVPDNHVALAHVAHITGNVEMKDKALQILTALMKDKPEYPDLLNDMGRVFYSFNEYSKAREFFEKALNINPMYTEARINLAMTLGEMNMVEVAIKHLMEIRPKNIRIFYYLGNFFYKTGRFFEAMAAYNRVSSLNDSYFDTPLRLENLSEYFAKLNNLLELHKRLAKNSPEYPDIHYKMGNLYLLVGKRQDAIDEFKIALKLKPAYVEADKKLEMINQDVTYDIASFLGEEPVDDGKAPDFSLDSEPTETVPSASGVVVPDFSGTSVPEIPPSAVATKSETKPKEYTGTN